jgi:hypothetical protein
MTIVFSSVRPELVEGLFFLFDRSGGQGFDKLSPNGVFGVAHG